MKDNRRGSEDITNNLDFNKKNENLDTGNIGQRRQVSANPDDPKFQRGSKATTGATASSMVVGLSKGRTLQLPDQLGGQNLLKGLGQPQTQQIMQQNSLPTTQKNRALKHAASAKSVFALSTASSSMFQNSTTMSMAGLQGTQLAQARNHKLRKQDEGFEGLPEEFKLELEIEDAEQCFSCHKALAKKFGGIMKKGRHHCRRCARTVCDRCRQNKRRLSKNDKQEQLVCDQCDFEIGNYHVAILNDNIHRMQENVTQQVTMRNQQLDKEVRLYRETKKDLQKEVLQKKDDLDQAKSRHKSELQHLNMEHERLKQTQDYLAKTQATEQEKRLQLQSEKHKLAVRAADLDFTLQQQEGVKNQMAAQQKQLWRKVKQMFPEDIQEIIQQKFDRVKGLTDSEMIMDSNTSDHQMNLMMMMQDDSMLQPY